MNDRSLKLKREMEDVIMEQLPLNSYYKLLILKFKCFILMGAFTRFFFTSNTFISNTSLKLAKNEANGNQHPEAELLLFENDSHSSSSSF